MKFYTRFCAVLSWKLVLFVNVNASAIHIITCILIVFYLMFYLKLIFNWSRKVGDMRLSSNVPLNSVHKDTCINFKCDVNTRFISKTDLFIVESNPHMVICSRHLNDIACYGGSTINYRWWPRDRYCWLIAVYNIGLSRCIWHFCVKEIWRHHIQISNTLSRFDCGSLC